MIKIENKENSFIGAVNALNAIRCGSDPHIAKNLYKNSFWAMLEEDGTLTMFCLYSHAEIEFTIESFFSAGGVVEMKRLDLGWNHECFREVAVCTLPKKLKEYATLSKVRYGAEALYSYLKESKGGLSIYASTHFIEVEGVVYDTPGMTYDVIQKIKNDQEMIKKIKSAVGHFGETFFE